MEKGVVLGNSKGAHNTLEDLTKIQQHKSAVIEDSSGNILIESTAVLNRWTEYCSGLYKYELHPVTSLLQSNQNPTLEARKTTCARGRRWRGCAFSESNKVSRNGQHPLRAV